MTSATVVRSLNTGTMTDSVEYVRVGGVGRARCIAGQSSIVGPRHVGLAVMCSSSVLSPPGAAKYCDRALEPVLAARSVGSQPELAPGQGDVGAAPGRVVGRAAAR